MSIAQSADYERTGEVRTVGGGFSDQNFSLGGVGSRGDALSSGWRDRPRVLYARAPGLTTNPEICQPVFPN
jgi:hypothetical protein